MPLIDHLAGALRVGRQGAVRRPGPVAESAVLFDLR